MNSPKLEDGGKAREADYCLQPMLWGFVPEWHRGAEPTKHGYSTNNARIEGVVESKLYRRAIGRGQRCVVICDGEALVQDDPPIDLQRGPSCCHLGCVYLFLLTVRTNHEQNKTNTT